MYWHRQGEKRQYLDLRGLRRYNSMLNLTGKQTSRTKKTFFFHRPNYQMNPFYLVSQCVHEARGHREPSPNNSS